MNVIQMKERIDFLIDRPRNPRYFFSDYNKALRDSIKMEVDMAIGNDTLDPSSKNYFQASQQIRDKISTLIKTATPTKTGNILTLPTDYYFLVMLNCTIDGVEQFARPTTYGELGPLKENPYRKPSNTKPYYIENNGGYEIFRSTSGTFNSASMIYIKNWAQVYIGTENNRINAGAGVLTNATGYTALEESVHNAITYNPGDQFTSANTNLTSGQVILTSLLVDCDLPAKTHEGICRRAADIIKSTTAMPSSQ